MRGYKVFNSDFRCNMFLFEIGKTYKHEGKAIKLCSSGFHFCKKAADCFSYYSFDPDNIVCEIDAIGNVIESIGDSKCVTSEISIVRRLSWGEVLEIVNSGNENSGYANSGNGNSGHVNSGDRNSGDGNSGHGNSGDYNSGHRNSGDRNSGDRNSGYRNSCNGNSGNYNSGYANSGDRNSGNGNSGSHNSGHYNSGDRNSGDGNSGKRNSGNYNSGHGNSGDGNSGYENSGYYNSGNYNSGFFNTDEPRVRAFNRDTGMTRDEFERIMPNFSLSQIKWVVLGEMTDEEKSENPSCKTTGGFLRIVSYKDAWRNWWKGASADDRLKIKNLPNFDAEIFKEITGIDVNLERR